VLAVNGTPSQAKECHLPHAITQCYLLSDTSEHTPVLINTVKWSARSEEQFLTIK